VANTLRFGAPEAFEFLLENHMQILGLKGEDVLKTRNIRLKAIESKWAQTAEAAKWDAASAKRLVQFLFPCWYEAPQEAESLQGIQVFEPTDYWSRYLSEDIDPDTIRDQELLHDLEAWRQDAGGAHFRNARLSSILCTNVEFASKFEHFAPLILTGKDVRSIATTTFKEALDIQGVAAFSDSVVGFIPLCRLAIRQPIDETAHLKWVENEICVALRKSLRFANDVYYFWRSNKQADIGKKTHRIELRHKVRDGVGPR